MDSFPVVAVIVFNSAGHMLQVRKRGTRAFIFPGGKPEPGESVVRTAVREVREETGLKLRHPHHVGVLRVPAANEPGLFIDASLVTATSTGQPVASGEIDAVAWVDPCAAPEDIAPLSRVVFAHVATASPRVTVFAGAQQGHDPRYRDLAADVGHALAQAGMAAVYGGGSTGLMGAFSTAMVASSGDITGVMPTHLMGPERASQGLTRFEEVKSMHERKDRMLQLGDAVLVLPGGPDTLEEFFEAWVWRYLGLHHKPIILVDSAYWAPLLEMVEKMEATGLTHPLYREMLLVADHPDEVVQLLHCSRLQVGS